MAQIKIKKSSGFYKKLTRDVLKAFEKRNQSVAGTKYYIDEHNKHYVLTMKTIRQILAENGIKTKKKGVKNV